MKNNRASLVLALALTVISFSAIAGPGDIDPAFNPGSGPSGKITGAVNALAVVEGDQVLIGGVFTNYNGFPARHFARVNSDGSLDGAFMAALGANFDSEIDAISVQSDGKILVGGDFLNFDGSFAGGLARLNSGGGRDGGFSGYISGSPLRYVSAIVVQPDGKILIGGGFTTANGNFRRNIARLNSDGSLDEGFTTGIMNANSSVSRIAVQPDGRILVGGAFTNWAGIRVPGLARLYADGSFDYSFSPAFQNVADVDSLALLSDGRILAGGNIVSDFSTNGVSRFVVCLNGDGSEDLSFSLSSDGWAGVVAQLPDNKILVGGIFTTVNSSSRGSLARLNFNGTVDTSFVTTPYTQRNNGYLTHVYALAPTSNGKLMVGGWFTNFNGQGYSNVVRVENQSLAGPGTLQIAAATFSRLESNTNVFVPVIRTGGNAGSVSVSYTVLAGSATAGSDFVASSGTLAWAPGEMAAKSINVSFLEDSIVEADETIQIVISNPTGGGTLGANNSATLVIQDDDSVASFLSQPSNLSVNAGSSFSFTTKVLSATQVAFQWYRDGIAIQGATSPVLNGAAAQTNEAGAYFVVASNAAGFATSVVATLTVNVPAGTLLGFSPSQIRAYPVRGIGIQSDGKVVVGGSQFFQYPSSSNRIGRFDANGLFDPSFDARASGNIYALARLPDDKILIAGEFGQVNGTNAPRLARLNADGTLDSTFATNSYTSSQGAYSLIVQSDGKIVAGFSFAGGVRRFQSNGVVDSTWTQSIATNGQSHITTVHQTAAGDFLVGGYTIVSSLANYWIARLATNGALIAMHTNIVSREVNAISSLPDGSFYAGGGLVGGSYLRRFSASGQLLGTNAVNQDVYSLHLDGAGRLTVGGTFTQVDGSAANRLVRLNADGTIDSNFNVGTGPSGPVYLLRDGADGELWAGGDFVTFNGQPRLAVARLLGGPAALLFGTNGLAAFENAGTVSLTLRRVSGNIGSVSVTVASSDAQGAAGVRYAPLNQVVSWADGDAADKIITLTLLNNATADGDVPVTLQLSSPTGPAVLGLQSSATVTILDDEAAPFILTQPGSAVANVGGSASFSVVARSAGPMTYQWRRNGTNLVNATNAIFSLTNITATNAGNYTVVVSNANGSTMSLTAQLIVVPAPGRAITNSYIANFNSTVKAIAPLPDGQALVAGYFTTVSNYSISGAARLRPDGLVDSTFSPAWPFATIRAEAVAPLPNNGVLVGGAFNTGFTTNFIRGFTSNGTLNTSFNLFADGIVRAMIAEPDGRVLVGGNFQNMGGSSLRRLARLTTSGGVAALNIGNGFNGEVFALARQSDGKILVGGAFTTFDAVAANRIVRLNSDGTRDNTFNAGAGPNTNVFAIAILTDGRIAIGGDFTSVNGTNRVRLAVLNTDGSLDLAFNPSVGPDQAVRALIAQPDGDVLAAGSFMNVNSVARGRMARFNADGTFDAAFNAETGFNNPVFALAPAVDGGIYAGGDFTQVQGRNVSQFTKLYGAVIPLPLPVIYAQPDDVTTTLGSSATLTVFALSSLPLSYQWFKDGFALSNSALPTLTLSSLEYTNAGSYSVLVNSSSGSASSRPATLTVLAPPMSIDTNLLSGLGADGPINALNNQADESVLVGGSFFNFGGQARLAIARLDHQLNHDTNFSRVLSNWFNPNAYALHQRADGAVVAGGDFLSPSFSFLYALRLTAAGSLDNTFSNAFNSGVRAMLPDGDGYIFGGFFNTVGGATRRNLARVDGNGIPDTNYNTGVGGNGVVNAIVRQPDGKVLVGGGFTTFNGGAATRLIRLNTNGAVDSSFNLGSGIPNGEVRAIAVQPDGKILVGGTFATFNSQSVGRMVRLETNGALDAAFIIGSGASNTVNAIAIDPQGKILVGGDFVGFNGQLAGRLLRLNTNGTTDSQFNLGGTFNQAVNVILPRADGSILVGGSFWLFNSASAPYLVRLLPPVIGSTPVLSQQPASIVANAGTNITFAVVAAGQNLTYQWRKEGVPLVNGGRVTGVAAAQIAISNVSRADSGGYSVVVSSGNQSITSSNAQLSVRVPQSMAAPELSGGSFRLRFNDPDGGVATPDALSRIQVQFSTNLPAWYPLPGSARLTNGMIELLDTNPPGPLRFYRVLEN